MSRFLNPMLLAVACCASLQAGAASIALTDPNASYLATATNCSGVGGPWAACGVRGILAYGTNINENTAFNFAGFNTTGNPGVKTFQSSFNSWNQSNAGNTWTLRDGGQLAINYAISTFQTFGDSSSGGVTIQVDVTAPDNGGTPVNLSSLEWTQALALDYRVQDAAGVNYDPPLLAMDTFSFNLGGSAIPSGPCSTTADPYCDPAYPFQYSTRFFYDQPSGLYPRDSFRGIALLSSIDAANKTLTVYDTGVNYGFDVFLAPEPGTLALLFGGLGFMAGWGRSRVRV